MSTTYDVFENWLKANYGSLTLLQKAHTIQRLYQKIRRIHNVVGDVYQGRLTVQQFQTEYPTIYSKLAPELSPYVSNGSLSEEGWRFFLKYIFDPRHDVITRYICKIRKNLREAIAEFDLEPL